MRRPGRRTGARRRHVATSGSIACPIITSWPEDGGPFITLPLVYTTHPVAARAQPRHVSAARATTGSRPACTGRLARAAAFTTPWRRRANESLPATVFLGGPPALILSAIAPLPENVPELMLASLIAGERLPQVRGAGRPSASADRVGGVRADGRGAAARAPARGPVRRSLRLLLAAARLPGLCRCKQIAHRRDAIYPATIVGKPRQEDFFIGDLLQELLSPLFPLVMPAVEQLWSYGETGYHSLGAAVVKQRYKREAMASAFRILGEGQLSLTKFLLLTDRAVEPEGFSRDARARARAHAARRPISTCSRTCRWTRSTTPGRSSTKGRRASGSASAIPVRELPREFRAGRRRPRPTSPTSACSAAAVSSSARAATPTIPTAPARLAGTSRLHGLAAGRGQRRAERATRSVMNFLWTTFTRFEPAADIHAADRRIVRNHIAYEPPIVDRCADEAVVSEGGDLPRRHRAPRHRPLARVLSVARRRDG